MAMVRLTFLACPYRSPHPLHSLFVPHQRKRSKDWHIECRGEGNERTDSRRALAARHTSKWCRNAHISAACAGDRFRV